MSDTAIVPSPQTLNTLLEDEQRLIALYEYLYSIEEGNPDAEEIVRQVDADLQETLRTKVEAHVLRHRHLVSMRDKADAMQRAFLDARLSYERESEHHDKWVLGVMQSWEKKELTGAHGLKIKLRNNPPSVLILDESQIPDEFRRTVQPPPVTTISRMDIKKAIQAGRDVSGADLKLDSVKVVWGDEKAVVQVQAYEDEPDPDPKDAGPALVT